MRLIWHIKIFSNPITAMSYTYVVHMYGYLWLVNMRPLQKRNPENLRLPEHKKLHSCITNIVNDPKMYEY